MTTAIAVVGGGLAVTLPSAGTDRGAATAAPDENVGRTVATSRYVRQTAEPGVRTVRTRVAADGPTAGARRVCHEGAKWLRIGFDDLALRGDDTLTLKGSGSGSTVLTSRNAQGKAFYTKALEGGCVTLTPRLDDTGSRYSIASYQAGARPLARADVVLAAVGDICGSACNQTDDVVTRMNPAALITAGDNAYDKGSSSEYRQNYDPHWGRFNKIVRPTPGNHEYRTSGASGYFGYYEAAGAPTGGRGKGYYSFDVGDWHLVALNSNISRSASSAQGTWLKRDLAASTKPCTMAYWHHPRFSSGDHGDQSGSADLYKILTDHKADVVVNGHDHHYERFAPATVDGRKDEANGLRQFVIGTGGRGLYSSTHKSKGPSEVFNNKTFGVGQFDLSATGYKFTFRPVDGRTFTDSAQGTCHAKPRP
ncbi:metallophosphoesterase family protein [Streptomyces silvensis]|nr:metallophosphoesterase [Streptomyces silvensis]